MRIGFLGLGRLGLPIASVLSQHHTVDGYDPDPSTAARLVNGHPWEEGLEPYLGDVGLAATPEGAVDGADLVVVAVPTPHEPHLEGTLPTDERAPFDLSFVRTALSYCRGPVMLMSTVLPGDCRSLDHPGLIYSPQFIAMGTTVADFLGPEFILTTDREVSEELMGFIGAPIIEGGFETIELAKMAYNTAIGLKIALANTVAWLADETGAHGGEVMDILAQADKRVASPAYMRPGLGDGGACHPRDQLALSYLARECGVYDIFSAVIDQRTAHSAWLASLAAENPVILGASYKPGTPLRDGSPAILMANQTGWEITENPENTAGRNVVIGVRDESYAGIDFDGEVLDPFGIIPGAVQPGRRPLDPGRVGTPPSGRRSGRHRRA